MRCFNCHRETTHNAMDDLNEEQTDRVVDSYGLIHLQGPEDMFSDDGWVIICRTCVRAVAAPFTFLPDDDFHYHVLLNGSPDDPDTPYKSLQAALDEAHSLRRNVNPNATVEVRIVRKES